MSSASLAPGMAEFVRISDELFPRNYISFSLDEQRDCYRAMYERFRRQRPAEIETREAVVECAGWRVPLRIYRASGGGSAATILYFHGGGWIFGNLDSHDDICAELAAEVGATVIAADYPLAPENRYPAAVKACYDLLCRVAGDAEKFEADPGRLAVAGDSAGGNIAASLALRASMERGPALRAQLLVYPSLGASQIRGHVPSKDEPLLEARELDYYREQLFGENTPTGDPFAFPLCAERFSGLPATFILAAEHDPLLIDAQLYDERLRSEEVDCRLHVMEGTVHACLRARAMAPVVDRGIRLLVTAARDWLG